MAGKGDKPRPVDKKTYNNNFDQIVWNKDNNKLKNIVNINAGKISLKY
jgi:hypothetical protein